jgi:hypothetical protein
MSVLAHGQEEQANASFKAVASGSGTPKRLGKNSTGVQLRQALRDLGLDDHGKKETLVRCDQPAATCSYSDIGRATDAKLSADGSILL